VAPPLEPPFGREMIYGIFHPFLVYTIIVVLGIAIIFYWLIRRAGMKGTPLEILKKRYAEGEIDTETYKAMKKELLE
jgi:uncharacterized membrane protein